jgi:hypothetical protein
MKKVFAAIGHALGYLLRTRLMPMDDPFKLMR